VPRDADYEGEVTGELEAMFEHAGRFGPSNLLAQGRRARAERRARRWIEQARAGEAEPGSPLAEVAGWSDAAGRPLPVEIAAVELINLLRPTVAVADFLVYAALALAVRPRLCTAVLGQDGYAAAFGNEVRRHAPFFPGIAGTAARPLEWQGQAFEEGDRVLLDLYGTNHDSRLWPEPDRFRPERFLDGASPQHIVAQGSGDLAADHRCPRGSRRPRCSSSASRVDSPRRRGSRRVRPTRGSGSAGSPRCRGRRCACASLRRSRR
jgi:fatty-acid peroxygenase